MAIHRRDGNGAGRLREAIGARLRQAREENKLSQIEAANRLKVTRLTVIKNEQGAYELTDEKLSRYAELYGRPLHWLRYGAAVADAPDSTGVRSIPVELPTKVRVWVYEFLTELVRGGATDQEVQKVHALLAGPHVADLLNDRTPGTLQLTDDELIGALEQVGNHLIRLVLRKRGRRV